VVMFGDNKNRLRTLHREYPDSEYIPLMFDNSQHLVKPAYYKALSDCAFYRDILDKKASLVQ